MITTVQIIERGDSVSIELSREILELLHVSAGDTLTVTETPTGIQLSALDVELAMQMELAEQIMREDRDVLAKLAQ